MRAAHLGGGAKQCGAARVSDDPYVYPGTDELRNNLGIRDGEEEELEVVPAHGGSFEANPTSLSGFPALG